jgi:hypothetical protein
MVSSGDGLIWPCTVLVMGWAAIAWAGLNMGCPGHRPDWPWAGLPMSWDGHGLGWPCSGLGFASRVLGWLAVFVSGQWLASRWTGPAMVWACHGLGWP